VDAAAEANAATEVGAAAEVDAAAESAGVGSTHERRESESTDKKREATVHWCWPF
jgi:hypothetical protein